MGRSSSWTFHGRFPAPSQPDSFPGRLFFYGFFCSQILLESNDFCFCLRSCDGKFSRFVHFPCILECFFFLSFLVGGGVGAKRVLKKEKKNPVEATIQCMLKLRLKRINLWLIKTENKRHCFLKKTMNFIIF